MLPKATHLVMASTLPIFVVVVVVHNFLIENCPNPNRTYVINVIKPLCHLAKSSLKARNAKDKMAFGNCVTNIIQEITCLAHAQKTKKFNKYHCDKNGMTYLVHSLTGLHQHMVSIQEVHTIQC